MAYDDYTALQVEVADGIARATIDHPPINLLDLTLILDLDRFGQEVAADDDVRVVVLSSADPEFFAAHADVTLIQALPTDDDGPHDTPGAFQVMADRFRSMPKATIAVIEGIARGGGSELVLACDLRFASEDAVLAQPEALVGIIPGGGATQRLPRLLGRARALEVVLSGDDVDARTAEAWGYVNRTLPEGDLWPFVDRLAARIAALPASVIRRAKEAVDVAVGDPTPGLLEEDQRFRACLADPTAEADARMGAFLAAGGQTRDVEVQGFPSG